MDNSSNPKLLTRMVHTGKRVPILGGEAVNPSLVRASTVLFQNTAEQRDLRERRDTERVFTYGARGTPTTFALEDVVSELEGAYRTRLFPTGLAAIGFTLLSYLKPGDHVLMSDSVYEPARALTRSFLESYDIHTTFFKADGSDLALRWQEGTRMVYVECPGSLVYEMCDLPAQIGRAHV